jgi:hypothetical protein
MGGLMSDTISARCWKAIDDAGLKRASIINNLYKSWSIKCDEYLTMHHMNMAIEIMQSFPELCDYSIGAVKGFIADCSEEYVVQEAKEQLHLQ